jgi:hypothetical protein
MNPAALYDALNNLALAVLFSEGEPDAERRRIAANALGDASLSVPDAFPAGSPEAEALNIILAAVSSVPEMAA